MQHIVEKPTTQISKSRFQLNHGVFQLGRKIDPSSVEEFYRLY